MSKELKPLSAKEESLSYAKYYNAPMAPPNPVPLAELGKGPMDPGKALALEDMNMLLDPGYHDVENGYCTMENGIGYLCVNNTFPGVTIDMMDWWFAWHACGCNLRYKIWNPEDHRAIAISAQDKRKLADPNLLLKEKHMDVDHFVVEDIGGGDGDLVIRFKRPENMGFDLEKLKKSPVKSIYGGYGVMEPRNAPGQKSPSVMVHTAREIENGIEFRTRFWMGARIVDGKPVCVLPHGVKVPYQAPMGLAYHNVKEYSNLAVILPQVYAEYGAKNLFED